MPASAVTKAELAPALRVPQARVLAVLVPPSADEPEFLWPVFTRTALAERVGYTALSGTLNRALKGIPDTGNKSGDPHLGLLGLGYVVEEPVEVCGVVEMNYRATAAGVTAYRAWVAAGNVLPPPRDKAASVNTTRGYINPHV